MQELIFMLLPGEEDQELQFRCSLCYDVVSGEKYLDRHALDHGQPTYKVKTVLTSEENTS